MNVFFFWTAFVTLVNWKDKWISGLKAKTRHEIHTEEEVGKQMRITRENQQVKQEIIYNIMEQSKLIECVLSRESNKLEEERLSHETAFERKLEEKTGKETEWIQRDDSAIEEYDNIIWLIYLNTNYCS